MQASLIAAATAPSVDPVPKRHDRIMHFIAAALKSRSDRRPVPQLDKPHPTSPFVFATGLT
jgi:hypothetical protein